MSTKKPVKKESSYLDSPEETPVYETEHEVIDQSVFILSKED